MMSACNGCERRVPDIRVPTGVQDYRPALHGGIAAIELRVDRIARTGLDVDPRALEERIVLAYTGAPRNSGTNNWEITKRHIDGDRHIFDCFDRIRDTAVAMRTALQRGDWDEVGRQIAKEWDNRKRLAPGVSTPAIDDLMARAAAARAAPPPVHGPWRRGCLFCWTAGPPSAIAGRARRAGLLVRNQMTGSVRGYH
jgi:D-glycero-alpha-D-manno-heptose-7-phosphate kinase